MGRILKPLVRGGGWYPSKKWIPLVKNGGYTTQNGGETEPVWATISGTIASFTTPFAYPLKKLVAQINPVQDLHGYEYPWPAGGGANILRPVNISREQNGITVTGFEDGKITISGTATDDAMFQIWNFNVTADTYALILKKDIDGSASTWWVSLSGVAPIYSGHTSYYTFGSAGTFYVRINVKSGVTINKTIYPMVAKTATDIPYAPYSNICPISGWTGVQGVVTGVNLFDKSTVVSGQMDRYGNIVAGTGRSVSDWISIKPDTQYYVANLIPSTDGRGVGIFDRDKNAVAFINAGSTSSATSGVITTPSNGYYCRLGIYTANLDTASLNYPSTDTTYHTYTGEPISVSWQDEAGTVYGGQDEVVSGNGTSTMGMVDLGTLTWRYESSWGAFASSLPDAKRVNNAQNANWVSSVFYLKGAHYGGSPAPNLSVDVNSTAHGAGTITIKYDEYGSDATAFKTAMSGVQLCYELETPQTFTHDPQEVDTLVGQNNVFVDTGSVEVTYRIE